MKDYAEGAAGTAGEDATEDAAGMKLWHVALDSFTPKVFQQLISAASGAASSSIATCLPPLVLPLAHYFLLRPVTRCLQSCCSIENTRQYMLINSQYVGTTS